MSQPQRSTYDTAEASGASLDVLKAELSKLAETVKGLATEQFGTSVNAVQDKAAEKVSDLETSIRRNPTQAAAIAAGVGFLIGLILTR